MEQAQFWGVNKKSTCMKMRMEAFNVSMFFGAMISALQQECQEEVEYQNICYCGSEVIMDDILLLKILQAVILQYFEVVL